MDNWKSQTDERSPVIRGMAFANETPAETRANFPPE